MSARGNLKLVSDNPEPVKAANGATVTINDDGSIDIEPAAPAVHRPKEGDAARHDANLAEGMDDGTRMNIATEALDGIAADILSRSEFIASYNKGIDLLGLKIEDASASRGNRTSISKVRDTSLLKACIRSQSLTRAQMLPAEGPCKVQTISGETEREDDLARDFQQDFNYYLTKVDKGFYPDVNKSLFYRAFGGSVYRKVYRDPILRRPVSRFTPLENFIVSEDTTDLHDALRQTNELYYNRVQVRRMQIAGGWLDIDLAPPMQPLNPARQKILQSQGLSTASMRPEDTAHTIYETNLYLEPGHYGFSGGKDAPDDMPLPFRVTIDRDSRQVLALHRNWKRDDEFFQARQTFVKYGLVSGLGFLDYGFLHLMGNQVRVLTAIKQIMIDKGMLSTFPGGLKVKGIRAATNELNPGLGEWVEVDIGSLDDIRKALMAMPYGEISASFIQLMEIVQKDVEGMGGVLDIPTGEGTSNTPVGTILALVEQQSQDLTAVQQNDHRSQEEELGLLRDLFIDYPEDLKYLQRKGSDRQWSELVDEFRDLDLVPASDPNIPSQSHRILINQFILELAEKAPYLFGSRLRKVAKRILVSAGVNDADDLLAPQQEIEQARQQMSQQGGKGAGGAGAGQASLAKAQMELPLKQAEVQVEQQRLALEEKDLERQAANEAGDQQLRTQRQQVELAHAERELQQNEHSLALEGAGLAAQAQAAEDTRRNLNAKTFASMGAGAQGFAKAGETVADGERDAARLDLELDAAGREGDLHKPAVEKAKKEAKVAGKPPVAAAVKAPKKPKGGK